MSSFTELLDAIPLETVQEVCNVCEKFTDDVTRRFGDITCAVSEDGSDEVTDDFFDRDIFDVMEKEPTIMDVTPGCNKDSTKNYTLMHARLARRALGRQNSWHGRGNPLNKRRKRHRSCTTGDITLNNTSVNITNNNNVKMNKNISPSGLVKSKLASIGSGRVCDSTSTDSGCSVRTPSHPDIASSRTGSASSYTSVFSSASHCRAVKGTPIMCTVYKLTYVHSEPSVRYAASQEYSYYGAVAMVTDMTSYYRADIVTCYYVQGNELELKDNYATSQTEAQRGMRTYSL